MFYTTEQYRQIDRIAEQGNLFESGSTTHYIFNVCPKQKERWQQGGVFEVETLPDCIKDPLKSKGWCAIYLKNKGSSQGKKLRGIVSLAMSLSVPT